MNVYVTTLVRYQQHGWLYKVDYARKTILEKRQIASDSVKATHGGPHGLAWLGDLLVTGTYSDVRFFDQALHDRGRFGSPLLSGVHGLSVTGERIWVSSCNNEAVVCFNSKGKVLEAFKLCDNTALISYFGTSLAPTVAAYETLDYRDQPFHVNHVQEIGDQLLVCLHKQGCIWDLRAGKLVAGNFGGQIHDAQHAAGGYLVNDTQHEKLRSFTREGTLNTEVTVSPYPFRGRLEQVKRKLGLNRKRECKVNWLRGLAPLNGGRVLVGSSPATVLTIDLERGRVADKMRLSSNICEAVFGVLSDTEIV